MRRPFLEDDGPPNLTSGSDDDAEIKPEEDLPPISHPSAAGAAEAPPLQQIDWSQLRSQALGESSSSSSSVRPAAAAERRQPPRNSNQTAGERTRRTPACAHGPAV
jgi:hypothetical protein